MGALVAVCFIAALLCWGAAADGLISLAPLEFFSILFGGLGGVLWFRERRFSKRAIIISGVVTGYREYEEERREDFYAEAEKRGFKGIRETAKAQRRTKEMYAPVVQFEFDGQTRQVTGTTYSSSKPKIGAVMKVGIDPQNIEDARVMSKFSFGFVFFAVGVLILATAVYMRIAGNS